MKWSVKESNTKKICDLILWACVAFVSHIYSDFAVGRVMTKIYDSFTTSILVFGCTK